jgi:hypothetical protein
MRVDTAMVQRMVRAALVISNAANLIVARN